LPLMRMPLKPGPVTEQDTTTRSDENVSLSC